MSLNEVLNFLREGFLNIFPTQFYVKLLTLLEPQYGSRGRNLQTIQSIPSEDACIVISQVIAIITMICLNCFHVYIFLSWTLNSSGCPSIGPKGHYLHYLRMHAVVISQICSILILEETILNISPTYFKIELWIPFRTPVLGQGLWF